MIATTHTSPYLTVPGETTVKPEPAPPLDPTDHELMLAVRDGEIARLGDLFERYHLPLFGFFVRLTRQKALSEDLVQLVFYRILKYRHTYRDEGKFSAWIYHLARKAIADHHRKFANRMIAGEGENVSESLADQSPMPSERAAQSEDLALMQVALGQLPLDQREVLVLHRFQNLRHEEIARLLDCSVGAVKVRAHRALGALRDIYFKIRRERLA